MKVAKCMLAAIIFVLGIGFSNTNAKASQLLQTGSTGSEVTYIQSVLKQLDYFDTNPTGYYGPITANAVQLFQRDFNLHIDGEIEQNTLDMLNNVDMMARVVNGEARGESYEGQVAVAAVILNRVQSSEFPDTIYNVIFQQNAFTAVQDGQYSLQPNSTAYRAVKDAFLGWDPSNGSLYYYNPAYVTDSWIYTREVTKQIGNHYFAY